MCNLICFTFLLLCFCFSSTRSDQIFIIQSCAVAYRIRYFADFNALTTHQMKYIFLFNEYICLRVHVFTCMRTYVCVRLCARRYINQPSDISHKKHGEHKQFEQRRPHTVTFKVQLFILVFATCYCI